MALAQKHRNAIYERLSPIVGDEETEALLLQFPLREQDEPATRELVRHEIGELRHEMDNGFADVRAEFADVRSEMRTGFAELREDIAGLRDWVDDDKIWDRLKWVIWLVLTSATVLIAAVGIVLAARSWR